MKENIMKQVDILKTTEDGQENIGSVILVDGKCVCVNLPFGVQAALEKGIPDRKGKLVKLSDGIKFLRSLKFHYNGSYLRATGVLTK